MSVTNTRVLRFFLKHVHPYRFTEAGILLSIAFAEIATVITVPWFYKQFFDLLAHTKGTPTAETMTALLHIIAILAGLKGIGWLGWRISGFLTCFLQPRDMVDLSYTCLENLLSHSHQFFTNNFAGALVKRVNRLTRAFETVADNLQFRIIPLLISTIGIVTVIFWRSTALGWASVLFVTLFISINLWYVHARMKYVIQRAAKDSEVTGVLSDAMSNSHTVQLFNGQTHEISLFKRVSEEWREIMALTWRMGEWNFAIQALLTVGIEICVIYISLRRWEQGLLTVGDFALFQGYLISLNGKLWDFTKMLKGFYEAFADAREMIEIIDTPHEVRDKKRAKHLQIKKATIQFQGVTFSYHQLKNILSHLNLKIHPHEKVAFVGPSGAGKSTITKLLFRFFDIQKGKVLIDDQDISAVTLQSLRESLALVPQEPVLFHRSLLDNIRYGRLDATDDEVIDAAKRAHCHEFIGQLPQGYNTFVGERGVKLSGGERQRVAIARAILKDAPILVLDEATSSLDSESEYLIQEALKELMKQKTVIVIAHRLSTIMQMDRIIVLQHGTVVDSGTHTDLVGRPGVYKTLWDIQAGGFLP